MTRNAVAVLLIIVTGIALQGCGGGSSGGGDALSVEAQSAAMTNQAVSALLAMSDDFPNISNSLDQALTLYPGNESAAFFKAVVDFLAFCKLTALPKSDTGTGEFHDLFTRAGYVNPNEAGSFWDFTLEAVPHGEGEVKDSTPKLEEGLAFLVDTIKPALLKCIDDLDRLSPAFSYTQIWVSNAGQAGLGIPGSGGSPYWIDYGDSMMLKATLQCLVAKIEILNAYSWKDVEPNAFDEVDFPGVDGLDLVETVYTEFLKLVQPSELLAARGHYNDAFESYKLGAVYIRNETREQEENGLLTLGRDTFNSQQERDDFLASEKYFRETWGPMIVNAFYVNSNLTVTTNPDGTGIDPTMQPTLNLYRFFEGIRIRDVYLRTVVDPFDAKKTLGITDLAQISPEMRTYDGVLIDIGGRVPNAGDVQEDQGFIFPTYAHRVDNPAIDTKVIDGSFSDWAANRTQIAATPQASFPHDLGNLYVARDADHLYVYLDEDLVPYTSGYWDGFSVDVESDSGFAFMGYNGIYGWYAWLSFLPNTFTWQANSEGLEFSIPLDGFTNDWVDIGIELDVSNSIYDIESNRSSLFVKIR